MATFYHGDRRHANELSGNFVFFDDAVADGYGVCICEEGEQLSFAGWVEGDMRNVSCRCELLMERIARGFEREAAGVGW